MLVDNYIESLINEGYEHLEILREGKQVTTIGVNELIAINLYRDTQDTVYEIEVLSQLGTDDSNHYQDTLLVIEATTRLLLDLPRKDRTELYYTLDIGSNKPNKVIIDTYIATYEVNADVMRYSIMNKA